MDPGLLALLPAAPPPPGVTSDFVNSEKYGLHSRLVDIVTACMVLMTVVLVLRLVARVVVLKQIDWSDYNAILGYIFSMSFLGITLGIDDKRRGRHQWDMPLLDYLQTTELENIASIMYCIGILFSKLSILFLFLKVFVPSRCGVVYWINLLLVWINVLFYIAVVVSMIFQCVPRTKISMPTLPGRCINVFMTYLLTAVWNVISDFFILFFPLWAIWHLHMPNNRKFCSSVAFVTGIFALLSSIMRLYSTTKIPYTSDLTWIISHVTMWTSAEMTTVFLCACFPFIPKLVRLVKRSRWPNSSGPSPEHLNDNPRSTSHLKPSMRIISVVEQVGDTEILCEPRQPEPAWKSPEKRDNVYSPV